MIAIANTLFIIVCILMITLILIQRGRGGGFIESFAGLESMFGTKSNAFLARLTSILAVVFFLGSLWLNWLSLGESRSIMRGVRSKSLMPVTTSAPTNTTAAATQPAATTAQQRAAVPAAQTVQTAPANQTAK